MTKEKILEILHSHSYNVEDQAGNHLIVVDDGSWDAVATEVKNCSIHDVSNCGGTIPYDSLSDSFKKSIDSIEDNLNR